MARRLLMQSSIQDVLTSVIRDAAGLVDGCDATSDVAARDGTIPTVAQTELPALPDHIIGQLSAHLGADAARRGSDMFRIDTVRPSDEQWPRSAEPGSVLGIGSITGLVLERHTGNNFAALTTCSMRTRAFGTGSEHLGWIPAAYARLAVASARHGATTRHGIDYPGRPGEKALPNTEQAAPHHGGTQDVIAQARERAMDKRDRLADERDRSADERDRSADERDRLADEREDRANAREEQQDQRERRLDHKEQRLRGRERPRDLASGDLVATSQAAIQRSKDALARSLARIERTEALAASDEQRAYREQAEIDHEILTSSRILEQQQTATQGSQTN